MRPLLPILLFLPLLLADPSSISGQQLLGSSFGIPGINASFHYVIIGGGNGGLVLANRLTENPNITVAIIEAGSFYELSNGNWSQIPRYVAQWTGPSLSDVNPLIDWGFGTVPQKGILNRTLHYARGKTLGGSTARNYMMYHRGTKGSYKQWAEMVGDETYEWDSFLPFFDKSTTFVPADVSKRLTNSTPEYDPGGASARSGPVRVTYTNYPEPISSWVKNAIAQLGMAPIRGLLGGSLIGSSWGLNAFNPETQVRDSAETAYLRPALTRPNLIVYQSTLAKRIIFDGNKTAVGVACDVLGKSFQLSAGKEVILSAGAFQSPQLLMVSGIGPTDTLQRLGIPVLSDKPGVGQGMRDHPVMAISRRVNVDASTVINTPAKVADATFRYLRNATGPFANTGGDVLGWEKAPRRLLSNATQASLNVFSDDWPELEYIARSLYRGSTPPDSGDYASIAFCLVAPLSQGSVTISSADTADPPVLDPAWLTHPADVEVAVAAFKRVREIFASEAMKPVLIGEEAYPGNTTVTDAQILEFIRNTATPIFHASCTCKMGKLDDQMAVVDSKGMVIGVQKLRVVDASAFPLLPPGHPMATVYALAEKIAADILDGA